MFALVLLSALGGVGFPELLVILLVGVLLLLPGVFYLLALQRTLEKCASGSRTLSPGLVWLMLIPLFNLVWHFIVVTSISKSLHNELTHRSVASAEPEPGRGIGLAMCILEAAGLIPLIGVFCGLAGFVCWIMYWVKVLGYSRLLDQPVG